MERTAYLEKIKNSKGKEKILEILNYSRYLSKIEPTESNKQAKEALLLARSSHDNKGILSSFVHLAYASFLGGNYQEAERWADRLLEGSFKENLTLAIGTAYNIKGTIAHQLNNHSEAIKYFLNAMDRYLELNNKLELLGCYNNLGMVYMQSGKSDEAMNFYQLALQIAEEFNNPAQNTIRMNMANILFEQKKYKKALDIYNKSVLYFRENEMKANEASALYNSGLSYNQLGKPLKAMENFLLAYNIYKKLNEINSISTTCDSIAALLISNGDMDQAVRYLEEAEALAKGNNLKWNLRKIYSTYAKYYETKGDITSANEYLHKLTGLIEEYYKENQNDKIAELVAKHKTQIYKLKSSELDEKNKVMQSQLDNLKKSLAELQVTHEKLRIEFENAVNRINDQDDLLSTQSRMAVMGEMISAIAHQWRQPLNSIGLLAQSIGDAWDFNELSDEFLEKQINVILGQVGYMNQTIDDFRDFFKPKFLNEFIVSEVIEKALNLVSYLLKINNIIVVLNLENECHLSGNPNELVQVIINIINNALDAMKSHNVKKPEIKIGLHCDSENVVISIFNKGEHINPDNLEKIFDPYFSTRGKEGTGIGLYICRLIIENKYDGSIKVINCENGVEFIITMVVKADKKG